MLAKWDNSDWQMNNVAHRLLYSEDAAGEEPHCDVLPIEMASEHLVNNSHEQSTKIALRGSSLNMEELGQFLRHHAIRAGLAGLLKAHQNLQDCLNHAWLSQQSSIILF